MSNHTEAELLEAMAHATLPEQRRISAELDDLRAIAAFNKVADAENDLANAIIEDHLTPVLVHGFHSTATDWLDEQVPDYTTADLHTIGTTMRAEASVWFSSVPEGVKANKSELREQARGIARRLGSQYGQVANQAADIFLEYVSRLVVADGTDIAGDSSAAGPTGREGGEDWSAGAPTLPVADGSTAPEDDAEGLNAPDPSVSGPAPDSPSDSAPTPTRSLPEEDTHNNPGDAAATGEIPPATAFLSAQQRANLQYLGTEEGQDFPVPGERDPEQDGEAASSLPVGVNVTDAPDSFPSFMPDTPAAPAPSTRAPNVQGSRRTAGDDEKSRPFYYDEDDKKVFYEDGDDNPERKPGEPTLSSRRQGIATGPNPQGSYIYADRDPWAQPDEHERWPEPGEGYPPTTSGDSQKPKHKRWPEPGEDYPPTTSGDSQKHDSRRHESVSTGPNPQGSFVYDPIQVEAKGYEEGFAYALTWSPGKPVPAALTSAATIGNKYNAEYVTGYKAGVGEGIATLSSDFQAAFASAHKQQVLSTRHESVKREAHPFKAGTGVCTEKGVEGEGVEPHCYWCNEHWNHPNHKASEVEKNRKMWASKTADANTRQFDKLDQEVAFPFTWSTDSSGGGKGAADVANVPTPGSQVANYPQPGSGSQEPAVGTEVTATEPVLDTEEDVPQVVANARRLAAAQRAVASRLGFRRRTAEYEDNDGLRPVIDIYDEALYEALYRGLPMEEAERFAEQVVNRTASKTAEQFIIKDWMGKTLFDGQEFPSFEDGWDHIYTTDPQTDDDEHYYDDYYVEPKTASRTAGEYGDTRPHQEDWRKELTVLRAETQDCRHCKSAQTRTGNPEAICGPHRDKINLRYRTHPASETYWAS